MKRTPLTYTLAIALILPLTVAFTSSNAVAASKKDPAGKGYPLVFSENFKKGSENWTMTDPKAWELKKDGRKSVLSLKGSSDYQPVVRSPHSIAWIKGLNLSSFVLEVNVKQTGREYGHRDTCLFFNKNSDVQYYYVHIATEADPHAHSIFKVDKEPRISIVQERTDGWKWDKEYHTVRIIRDAESGTIDVFVDDMENAIMHTTDKTFTSGTLGVGSFDDTGYFNEVTVWGTPEK
ncbi:MAG TPA: hypothetical protein EYN96_12430 [Candidatus Hydrogenedentes bacterium]|nr:hypothetical protein [Candidatus Hydrogenedentota bacterium]